MRLSGKTALITGGASGFGKGIATKFVAEGASVVISDINEPLLAETAKEIGATPQTMNVASADDWAAAAAAHGTPDILINNAGITHLPKPMETVEEDEFDKVLTVNAKSVYFGARTFNKDMKSRGSGAILNIASTAGLSPRPNLNWYNASKGWMITATKAMAVELAPFGIRVNALCPVAGETPLLSSFLGEDTPQMREKFISTIPIGRFSNPEDMANAACYLCSDEASMITGVAMEVDGGRCI